MNPVLAPSPALPALHATFLTILPRLQAHGRVYFRHRAAEQREEAIAEMVALAWRWHLALAARGKDAARFPSALATFAARAVASGRRACGFEKPKDVLSPVAQRRHGFTVGSPPQHSTLEGNRYDDALRDNTRTPVPDQVAFRHDFPAWRKTRSPRDRQIVDDLLRGERPGAVACRYGLSPARVSQLRRAFHDDWTRFCDGPVVR